jgi:gamma-glutamylcyclotransferase (GGCT)/AIG2-like uncharacterized protein YtfP
MIASQGPGEGTHKMTCQVFVYGTLKPGEMGFRRFCEPYMIDHQEAQSPGRLYHLPLGYPALTLEDGWVKGVLLTLSTNTALAKLDEFEAFYPDHPQDSEYQRLWHRVYDVNQNLLTYAWVYAMTRDQVEALGGEWLPDGFWTSH